MRAHEDPSDCPDSATTLVEIRTTFADGTAAADCAERLVAGGLAACVQVDGPVRSTYRWQNSVETAAEFRCTCKTTRELADACIEAITRGHGYETPEVIVAVVSASASYAAWVRASVRERPPGAAAADGGARP